MSRKIIGKIDGFAHGFLRGWVVDLASPRRRQCVDIFAGPAFLGQAACGFHRPDLEALGYGDGRHEFLFALDGWDADEKDVYVRVTSAPQVVLRVSSAAPEEVVAPPPGDRLRAYFDALVTGLSQGGAHAPRARSRHALLVAGTRCHGIPTSQFAMHIARKFGYAVEDRKTFEAFLRFYYERYGPYKAPFRIPLADEESAYWRTSPSGIVPRAAAAFAPVDYRASVASRNFEWAVNDAVRLCTDDDWVDEAVVDSLLKGRFPLLDRIDFPVNNFLRLFVRQNAALDGLSGSSVESRRLIFIAAMLHAVRARQLRRFLPSKWVEKLTRRENGDDCDLTRVLTSLLGYRPDLDGVVSRTFAAGAAPVPASVSSAGASSAEPADMVDIQLVGPFDRVLGLSESCRRLAKAIVACGYRVALANYDISNASPHDTKSAIPDNLVRARINILHLNLEEIPEALAFSLAPLSGSYIVAVPYFELSTTARCHDLGLKLVDEIWSPTTFLRDLFAPKCRNTHLVPLPRRDDMAVEQTTARAQMLTRAAHVEPVTLFLATADALSWVARKNIVGAIDAFQSAFSRDESVCLIIKTLNIEKISAPTGAQTWQKIMSRAAEDTRILLINELFDDDQYCALLAGIDCFVSLHRAEGLGLDILDAMTLGTSVIATAYSGNLDLCDATTSWPVAFDLVPVGEGNYPFAEPQHLWAEPRLASAVEALRDAYARPDERRTRAAKAATRVAAVNNTQAVAARVRARVGEILDARDASG